MGAGGGGVGLATPFLGLVLESMADKSILLIIFGPSISGASIRTISVCCSSIGFGSASTGKTGASVWILSSLYSVALGLTSGLSSGIETG